MSQNWTWLSGFASDLGVWEDELSAAVPEAAHTFIPYSKVIGSPDDLYTHIPELQSADVLLGMDLGALSMLRSVKSRPANQRWILLAPILDFCHGEDAWPRKQVLLMAKEICKMPKQALNNILELFGPADESFQNAWMETALKTPVELLEKGLEYLADAKIEEPTSLPNAEVRFGKEDLWVTPTVAKVAESLLPQAKILMRPKAGHWPWSLIG